MPVTNYYTEKHKFCRMLVSRMLSEFHKAHMSTGKRFLTPANVILASSRPEGPAMNRPGRKAGIGVAERWSAEGAALLKSQVTRLRRSIFHPESDPGLTAGPTNYRPFGPQKSLFQDTPLKSCRTPYMIFCLRNCL